MNDISILDRMLRPFLKGEEVGNAAGVKKWTVLTTVFLFGAGTLLKGLGIDVGLGEAEVNRIVDGVEQLLLVGNAVVHVVTTKKVGV